MRSVGNFPLGALMLAASVACGGETKETPLPPSDDDTTFHCPRSPDGKLGSGPFDGLLTAVDTCMGVAAEARSDIDSAVAALAPVFHVEPLDGGATVTLGALVSAIADYVAATTEAGLATTPHEVTCIASDEAARAAEAECRTKEDCDPTGGDCADQQLCQFVGQLNGLASFSCDPPLVEIHFAFASSTTLSDQTEFYTRVRELEVHAATILAAHARLSALVTGEVNGRVIFDPSPLAQVRSVVDGFTSPEATDVLHVIPQCRLYVVPTFRDEADLLEQVKTDSAELLDGGTRFAGLL